MRRIQIIASGVVGFFMLLGAINVIDLLSQLSAILAGIFGTIISAFLLGYGYFMYTVFKKLNTSATAEENKDTPEKQIDANDLYTPSVESGNQQKLPHPKRAEKTILTSKPYKPSNRSGKNTPTEDEGHRQMVDHENNQAELTYNANQSDGIADIMTDFQKVEVGSDGEEHPVYDDEKFIEHYKAEEHQPKPESQEKTNEELVEKISERVLGQIGSMVYDKTGKDILSLFIELQEKHYQITDLKEEMGIDENEVIEEPLDPKETRRKELYERIREANVLKDQIHSKQEQDRESTLQSYSYKAS